MSSGRSTESASDRDAQIGRRVLLATLCNYAGKVVTLGTWFLLTPFMLQHLGAASYGLWVLVSSVVAYGSLLDLGIGSAITKYVAEYRARGAAEQARAVIATSLWLYTGLGLLAFALSAVVALLLPAILQVTEEQRTTATRLFLLMGLSVGISMPCTTAGAVLRGIQRYGLLNAIAGAATLLTAVITVTVLMLGGGVVEMVGAHVGVTLVGQGLQAWAVHRVAPELSLSWRPARRALVRQITGFTMPIFVTNVAGQLQSKTDTLVIGAFMPVSAVTPYAIAMKLGELPQILTDQFMRVLLPVASELDAEDDPGRMRALFTTATRLTLAIAVPMGCIVIILADLILSAWVGPAYAEQRALVLILTVAIVLDTSSWPAASILQGMARHRPLALMAICSGIGNLGLSVVLVQQLGLTGVALGTLIPTAIEILLFVMPYAVRIVGVSPGDALRETVLPVLLPTASLAAVLMVARQTVMPTSLMSLAVVAGAGGLVYLAVYLAVGARDLERQLVRSMLTAGVQLFLTRRPSASGG